MLSPSSAEARESAIRGNLPLVVHIARRHLNRGLAIEDLIAEGNLALVRAVDSFDPSRGVPLSNHLAYRIKMSIRRAIANSGKTIRIPTNAHEMLARWRAAGDALRSEFNREPAESEIAERLDFSAGQLATMKAALAASRIATPRTDSAPSLDEAAADRSVSPVDVVERAEELEVLERLLAGLGTRELEVLRLQFGLDGAEAKPVEQIGEAMGVSAARVGQIRRRAMERLCSAAKAMVA